MREDLDNDDFLNDDDVAVITLEPVEQETPSAEQWTGPRCEKCQAPIKSDVVTICRSCGWYASLGTFVEVDQSWEAYDDTVRKPSAPVAKKSHIRVWLDLVPRWGWIVLASVLVVVLESIAARFLTPTGSSIRTAWSLTQLTLGVLAAAFCHVFNFVVLAAEDADFGVMDLFLKPLKLWLRAIHRLPTRLWVTDAAACGVTAVAMSMLVIGGLPYERLWDWGFQEPVKHELMGAMMDRAKQIESNNQDLEEAIGDFAGKGGVEGESIEVEPEKPRAKADCVILGYQTDRDGRLDALLLGVAHRGKLIYAGRVNPDLGDEERGMLLMELSSLRTLKPFIPMEAEATWVKPKFACRVTYGEQLKGGQLREVKWDRLLGSVRMN